MAFADRIEQPDLAVMWVLRLSGLPYLFSNVGAPSGWESGGVVTYDSEDYTWSPTLLVGDDFAQIASSIQPKGGLGVSSSLNFEFITQGHATTNPQDDLWLDLLCNSLHRTEADRNATTLAGNVAASGASYLSVVANPWKTESDTVLYLGTETLIAGDSGTNTSTLINTISTRGAYGSLALYHRAEVTRESEVMPTAPVVADYPISHAGRIAELWLCTGTLKTGRFVPYGDSLNSDENQVVYAGVVSSISLASDLHRVVCETKGLEHLINGPLVSNFPEAKGGLDPADSRLSDEVNVPVDIYIGPHNNRLIARIPTVHPGMRLVVVDAQEIADAIDGGATITITINGTTLTGVTYTTGSPSHTAGEFRVRQAPLAVSNTLLARELAEDINAEGITNISAVYVNGLHPGTIELEYGGATDASAVGASVSSGHEALLYFSATNFANFNSDNLQINAALQADDGMGGTQDANDLYPVFGSGTDTLGTMIETVLQEQLGSRYTVRVEVGPGEVEDGKSRMEIDVTIHPKEVTQDWEIFLYANRGPYDTFLRDLGFQDEIAGEYQELGLFKFKATRAPAAFRWPEANRGTPGRLYVHGFESSWHSSNFAYTSTSLEDDNGDDIPAHFVIDKHEVIEVSAWNASEKYLTVSARNQMTTRLEKEVYIELERADKQKTAPIYQCLAFPGPTSVHLMFLYLLTGGTGGQNNGAYDQTWEGAGLRVPSRLIDTASFTAIGNEEPQVRNNWCILKGDDARKVFNAELVLCQWQLITAGGQLRLISLSPPAESDVDDAWALTHAKNLVTNLDGKGVAFDRSTVRLVNLVNGKAGFNNASKKYALEIENRRADSIQNYGAQDPVPVDLRGFGGVNSAEVSVRNAAQRLFDAYAHPYGVAEVLLSTREAWAKSVGEECALTHDFLPSPNRAGRGVTGLQCRALGITCAYSGAGGGEDAHHAKVSLVSRAYSGRRHSRWAPSAYAHTTTDGGTTWRITDHKYSSADADKDVTHFAAGYRVWCFQPGDWSTAQSREIDSVTLSGTADQSTITLTASLSSTADHVFIFEDYNDANTTDTQRRYAYLSDGLGALDAPASSSASEAPFSYL